MGAPVAGTPLGGDAAVGACDLGPLLLEAPAAGSPAFAALSMGLCATVVALPAEKPAAAGTAAVLFATTCRFLPCGAATPSRVREAAGALFFFAAPCDPLGGSVASLRTGIDIHWSLRLLKVSLSQIWSK